MALKMDDSDDHTVTYVRCPRIGKGKGAVCGVLLLFVWGLAFFRMPRSAVLRPASDSNLLRGTALSHTLNAAGDATWPLNWKDAERHDRENPRTMSLEERLDIEREAPVCTHNFFHVLMPSRNVPARALFAAVSSVIAQNYSRFHLHLFDDGSDHEASKNAMTSICSSTMSRLSCDISKIHGGPGYGKFQIFSHAFARALPQDVFLIVDGDDFLHANDALTILNEAYQSRNCWNSWGSMQGKYSEEQGPLPPKFTNGKTVPLDRKTITSWTFSHPRSFKAFLWPYMGKHDFQYQNGTWLIKATDRCFIYSMLELSGARRSCYVKEILYDYVWGATPPSAYSLSQRQKVALFEDLKNRPPHKQIKELPEHVPSCSG
eukprot:GEMP01047149.1.p1 GENE.GEMP01047149.1~~GEMP01047149.1.p1  ORF type:complete len:375 (+),score=50.96 GEMP01047149.1:252-1376(+)